MEDANITTSVDVKVGHADMIEMLVEEQKELLETQIADKRAEFSTLSVKEEELKKKIEDAYVKELKLDERKELKPLIAAAKSLKLKIESETRVSWTHSKEPFDKDAQINLVDIGGKRNAMEQYKEYMAQAQSNNGRQKRFHHSEIAYVDTTFSACSKARVAQYNDEVTDIQLTKRGERINKFKPSATTKKLLAQLKKLTVEACEVDKEIFRLKCNQFELENSGARHKAKFLKAMLKNSETGQQLLGIMSKVGGTNLLEAGQDTPDK